MSADPWHDPAYWPALTEATRAYATPLATLDRAALRANADDLVRRAAGTPIRVASKSVRVRGVLEEILGRPGFAGVLAYALPEALWLAEQGIDDVVVGYPTADREALARLGADPDLARRVTIMIDSVDQLDLVDAAVAPDRRAVIRVCLEMDVSYDLPGLRVGVFRSPVRTPADAVALVRAVVERPGFRLVGLMGYEAQIAGLGDVLTGAVAARARTLVIRQFQRRSVAELTERRGQVVAAVREVADLEFVNGGGTGSIESTSADPSVTEVAAGSGLFAPRLFDHYRAFTPAPAAAFCLSVVRRPNPVTATLLGGGWIASGPPGVDRQPTPVWPEHLHLLPNEMAGEVQTPLVGRGARTLRVGDRVWLRHAKAGELSEHVDRFLVVDSSDSDDRWAVVDELTTYRGEGKAFL
ncbi:amino acid deaminase/aldolase [Mariniluteicoccus flavus]